MNEAHRMNGLQGQNDLSDVEPCPILGYVIVGHEVDQVAARHEIHDHVQVLVVLEGIMELDDPFGVGMRHNIAFFPEKRAVAPFDLKQLQYLNFRAKNSQNYIFGHSFQKSKKNIYILNQNYG